MPYGLCPMPYALCPMPYARRSSVHRTVTEKGYSFAPYSLKKGDNERLSLTPTHTLLPGKGRFRGF
jgi:hypothetical protein